MALLPIAYGRDFGLERGVENASAWFSKSAACPWLFPAAHHLLLKNTFVIYDLNTNPKSYLYFWLPHARYLSMYIYIYISPAHPVFTPGLDLMNASALQTLHPKP